MATVVEVIVEEPSQAYNSIQGDSPLDQAIVDYLPAGAVVQSVKDHGISNWFHTARISACLASGELYEYFLKCTIGDARRKILQGEFQSMSELYRTMPSIIPKPIACGKFRNLDGYFLLENFVEMSTELPDPTELCIQLAELHNRSKSPTGMFGFHTITYNGISPQVVDWDRSWAVMFSKFLEGCLKLYFKHNQRWPELEALSVRIIDNVVPRLLGPLQSEGRNIKPCLIHGDLWDGNIGPSLKNGNIYIFDAAAFYAHNEMELGRWRCVRSPISDPVFRQAYIGVMGVSEPVDQFDDRNRLYSLDKNIVYTVHHPDRNQERKTFFEDMCYLANKYDPKGADSPNG